MLDKNSKKDRVTRSFLLFKFVLKLLTEGNDGPKIKVDLFIKFIYFNFVFTSFVNVYQYFKR